MSAALPPLIPHFSALAPDYDVLLCDVWGVVHNGVEAFPHSCDALMRMRARGGTVVLITNSPRPSDQVGRQLERLHVPRETYDAIVSSGDVTRGVIEGRRSETLYHLGKACCVLLIIERPPCAADARPWPRPAPAAAAPPSRRQHRVADWPA